jgi:hypothetical protein
MIIGDPSDFAIEAMVEPDLYPPSSVWGRMCVWCGSHMLGDITNPHCALYSAYTEFRFLRTHHDDLWDKAFGTLDDTEIYNLLDQTIYGDDARTNAQIRAASDRFGRYNFLTNWGEQFDGWKAFLIRRSESVMQVLYSANHSSPVSTHCSIQGLTVAIDGFLNWFHAESDRLAGPGIAQ